MSFDMFLCCVRNGESASFKRALFEEIFARGAIAPRLPLTTIAVATDSLPRCMNLADRSGAFITWPSDGPQIAMPNQDVAAHLPPDLKNDPVAIVKSGRELEAVIGMTTRKRRAPE